MTSSALETFADWYGTLSSKERSVVLSMGRPLVTAEEHRRFERWERGEIEATFPRTGKKVRPFLRRRP